MNIGSYELRQTLRINKNNYCSPRVAVINFNLTHDILWTNMKSWIMKSIMCANSSEVRLIQSEKYKASFSIYLYSYTLHRLWYRILQITRDVCFHEFLPVTVQRVKRTPEIVKESRAWRESKLRPPGSSPRNL